MIAIGTRQQPNGWELWLVPTVLAIVLGSVVMIVARKPRETAGPLSKRRPVTADSELARRQRVRAADGSGEVPVPSYELFAGTEILGAMAMERMLAGLSTRRYPVGLEPVGEAVTASASATSKLAVSRKFVAMTETALTELLGADLSALDLVALMIDGCTSASRCASSRWASTNRAPSTRWRWWRARRRTPPPSPICSPGCVTAGWT